MGCGVVCYHNFTISLENLKKICAEEVQAIESHKDFEGWGSFAIGFESDYEFNPLVRNLFKSFKEKTSVGDSCLELDIVYYDEDNGDRYDEVNSIDGCVFCVHGVMRKSLPGEKFNEFLEENVWTQFG